MFLKLFESLGRLYPWIEFDLGLARGLDEEKIFPAAVLLDSEWIGQVAAMDYDLVFRCHFPMEDPGRPTTTKVELCCELELGIEPVTQYPMLEAKQIVAVHFHSTAVPDLANAPEDTALRIWTEIRGAGFVPIETHFEHVFHNPRNSRYGFADQHVRYWPARLETLMALLRASAAFVGVVSGPFPPGPVDTRTRARPVAGKRPPRNAIHQIDGGDGQSERLSGRGQGVVGAPGAAQYTAGRLTADLNARTRAGCARYSSIRSITCWAVMRSMHLGKWPTTSRHRRSA